MNKKILTFLAKYVSSFDELMGWKWSLENLWGKLVWNKVSNFFYWLKTSCQYAIFLWDNCYDWDYGSMLNLLRFKLQRKYDFFMSDKTNILEAKEVASQIKKVIDLIDKYQEDDFTPEEDKAHKEKWGEIKINLDEKAYGADGTFLSFQVKWASEKINTPEKEEEEREDMDKIVRLRQERQLECWNAIWDNMKNSAWWWD